MQWPTRLSYATTFLPVAAVCLYIYSCSFTLVQLHTSWDICMCDVFMVMLTHLFLTALLSFLCWWFVPLWWFLGTFARPESVNILIQNNLNKLDKAMRFGYAVRQAEIRHQALLSWFAIMGTGHDGPRNGRDLPPAHPLLFSFAAKGRCILPPLGIFIYFHIILHIHSVSDSVGTSWTCWKQNMIFISCTCKADDAVGTFVPLPVESEMCRKVRGFALFQSVYSSCFAQTSS